MVTCPICGREIVAPANGDLDVWCRCGECLVCSGQQNAEQQRDAAAMMLGGKWDAAPTTLVAVYAVFQLVS